MGRRPEPGAIRDQKAAVRSRRKPAEGAVEVPESGLRAPAWLKGAGLALWNKRAPVLRAARLLQAADEDAFARYCRNFARWLDLRADLDRNGYTYESESNHGKLRRVDPSFMIADRLERQLLAIEDRFGLNPAERQRIFLARSAGKGAGDLFPDRPDPAKPAIPARPAQAAPAAGFLARLN